MIRRKVGTQSSQEGRTNTRIVLRLRNHSSTRVDLRPGSQLPHTSPSRLLAIRLAIPGDRGIISTNVSSTLGDALKVALGLGARGISVKDVRLVDVCNLPAVEPLLASIAVADFES
jgi:hypothetical protein